MKATVKLIGFLLIAFSLPMGFVVAFICAGFASGFQMAMALINQSAAQQKEIKDGQ